MPSGVWTRSGGRFFNAFWSKARMLVRMPSGTPTAWPSLGKTSKVSVTDIAEQCHRSTWFQKAMRRWRIRTSFWTNTCAFWTAPAEPRSLVFQSERWLWSLPCGRQALTRSRSTTEMANMNGAKTRCSKHWKDAAWQSGQALWCSASLFVALWPLLPENARSFSSPVCGCSSMESATNSSVEIQMGLVVQLNDLDLYR